ncbi:MAG: thiol reductant ABC exporter subunit CydD [Veillonella caviae]|uniref:thiol reductant ABC exporter subunit CydD n=1 Tax=Veillonella caviae TaxID=248316 RepID=UPI0023F9C882|nr:thiol reductant ABC exporter subunit CydD [Veillonella caviae]MCI7692984.1 thiol reductant ABC exporter subunit CydD [Veillonella caviae]
MIQKTALTAMRRERNRLILLLFTSIGNSLSIVGQAWYFATIIDHFIFADATLEFELQNILVLLIMVALRLVCAYFQEHNAQLLGVSVKARLREEALQHIFKRGIQKGETQGDTIHLITEGLDQVDAYIARYIPQIIYAIMIPLVMGIAIMGTLPIIGFILLGTVPLIPFFMILIGKQAEKMNQEQWERMSFLSGHFLDVLRGITTLKVFGRSVEQIQVISRLSKEFKDSTLRVLRVAFISALVLELVSTISTAIVAVYLGLTLLDGSIDFFPAFFILLLAPEFYTPFRQLGSAFHTGMSGKASLEKFDAFMNKPSSLPTGGNQHIAAPLQEITFNNLTYTYDGTENGIRNISFTVKRNEPLLLVGESGAGKSTIAHLLGGFLQAPKGSILVNTYDINDLSLDWWRNQIAYVSQKPHIMKGSLRDCITFGRTISDAQLWEAINDAELVDVVTRKGLDFIVGEGGIGLSGGELQRIALARAFLQQPQVLILDEVTAHLDIKTEVAIGRALERLMKNRIVILIGHRLQTMHWAKQIILLHHGQSVESGTYDELMAQNGYFNQLVMAGTGGFNLQYNEEYHIDTIQSQTHIAKHEIDRGTHAIDIVVNHSGTKTTQIDASVAVESQRNRFRGWILLLSVLSPAKWSLVLALFFTFITVGMNVGLLSVSSWLLASAALQPGITYLSLAIVGVRFFGISRAVSRYFERYTSHQMAFQGLYGLRVWFYTQLEPLAPAIFRKWGAGDMLGRIMADIEVLQFFYLRTLMPPLSALLLTVLVAYGVGTIHRDLSLLVWTAAMIAGVILPYSIYCYHRHSLATISQSQGQMKSYLSDVLESMEDIISYNQVQSTIDRLHTYIHDAERHVQRIDRGMNFGNTLFLAIVQLVVIIAAILAAQTLSGPWTSVMVAVCAIGIQAWFESLQPMLVAVHHGYESSLAVNRLLAIKEAKPPITHIGEFIVENIETITFKSVTFSYEANQIIYDGLSMTIQKGAKVAIVGASGSGKTTLFSILERLYDYSGTIKIGNIDLKDISLESWRLLLGTITQHTYIFHASLEDNIRLANPDASNAELQGIIDAAGLTGVVHKLPQGLATIVGNGGVGLSGGERQRVALARLFLKNPSLVLLDEPLEGLDQVLRKQLHNQIMAFCKNKTLLYITHHLEGLESMDRIIFMDNGTIVEDGTFTELINKRGAFYEYCRLSMAGI